jgi:hypothetical protein
VSQILWDFIQPVHDAMPPVEFNLPSFVQIGLCRVGRIACRFRSARGIRTQFCTSDEAIPAEILGSRRTRVSVPRAPEGIKTLACRQVNYRAGAISCRKRLRTNTLKLILGGRAEIVSGKYRIPFAS